jgi:hypothetical protein
MLTDFLNVIVPWHSPEFRRVLWTKWEPKKAYLMYGDYLLSSCIIHGRGPGEAMALKLSRSFLRREVRTCSRRKTLVIRVIYRMLNTNLARYGPAPQKFLNLGITCCVGIVFVEGASNRALIASRSREPTWRQKHSCLIYRTFFMICAIVGRN